MSIINPMSSTTLAQFSILMDELLRTGMRRANFQSWEIDILLDIESCQIPGAAKRKALWEYQNAVEAELETGVSVPMRFSGFLKRRETALVERMPAKRAFPAPVNPKIRTH